MNKEQLIANVSLFKELDKKYIASIAQLCTERVYKPGDILIKQGEEGIGIFIITKGKVKVTKTTPDNRVVEIAENTAGDILGEFAVLDGAPRTATVTAIEETECLVLASWEFNSFMKTHPEVALGILPVVVRKFRETNDALTGLRA
ncbi:MAG TPA: cyclic nucleotide-binding domain-containing protein [Spirochaetia bacterium]|nr:cyclic nucleotide-binding domain-containing protein [Spirochaetales bacterium]HRS66265.1 cyclic nucleotide-binding domain-containing protein [Spirochaetia bacterium]HPD79503.1 cyclic nucleotide-binding domain-containing protein [Spirochaetales bacterium]HQG40242.1 cyclic nucleotide-binding domain-containing protein [Spirochaetales bacterium]HQK34089.1 cyclic nucleotide-binding domain-containing protein [Spirochaetales bacterium]